MKNSYSVKYRAPGKIFFRKVKNVVEDGINDKFRWLRLEDDSLLHFPIDSEVILGVDRVEVISKTMSREVGIPVQMK